MSAERGRTTFGASARPWARPRPRRCSDNRRSSRTHSPSTVAAVLPYPDGSPVIVYTSAPEPPSSVVRWRTVGSGNVAHYRYGWTDHHRPGRYWSAAECLNTIPRKTNDNFKITFETQTDASSDADVVSCIRSRSVQHPVFRSKELHRQVTGRSRLRDPALGRRG